MLFSFRQNISAFCLQNSDSIGGFPIRPAWDAYLRVSTMDDIFEVDKQKALYRGLG